MEVRFELKVRKSFEHTHVRTSCTMQGSILSHAISSSLTAILFKPNHNFPEARKPYCQPFCYHDTRNLSLAVLYLTNPAISCPVSHFPSHFFSTSPPLFLGFTFGIFSYAFGLGFLLQSLPCLCLFSLPLFAPPTGRAPPSSAPESESSDEEEESDSEDESSIFCLGAW